MSYTLTKLTNYSSIVEAHSFHASEFERREIELNMDLIPISMWLSLALREKCRKIAPDA